MEFVWTGPSWAAQSFDAPDVEKANGVTNLAREWGIPHFDASQVATGVPFQKNKVLTSTEKLPVIWVYPEPLCILNKVTGLSYDEFLQRSDWQDIRDECNDYCLKEINNIGRPVLLIGGHSDIVNCNYSNIQIAHHSWQKFIAESAELPVVDDVIKVSQDDGEESIIKHCWGAELIHRYVWENPKIDADATLVDSICDIFLLWKKLERKDLFYDVHPNKNSNIQFAKFLKPVVTKFLESTK